MKKICAIGLFVFLLLAGNCFASVSRTMPSPPTVIWGIDLQTHYDGTNFELYINGFTDDPVLISYFVNGEGPYPLTFEEIWGEHYAYYRDNITERLGGLPTDYNGETFSWIVQDQMGTQLWSASGVVSGLRQVELSTNLTITGDPLNPTLSWLNSDPDLDCYLVWLFDSSQNLYDHWYVPIENPSFTFPDDKLRLGQEYIIRIEAIDLDSFELSGDRSYCYAENISSLDINYTAPVPIPTTLLFLGSGLAGLAGLRKKFKKE